VKSHPPELRNKNLLRFGLQSLLEAETVIPLLWFEPRIPWLLSVLDPTKETIKDLSSLRKAERPTTAGIAFQSSSSALMSFKLNC